MHPRPAGRLASQPIDAEQLASSNNIRPVVGYGREGDVEYIVMTGMTGVPLKRLTLHERARADVLRELGRALRVMHRLDPLPFRESGLFPPMRTRPQRVSASKPTWSEPWSPPRPTPTAGRSHFIRGMPRSACTRAAARCRSQVPLHSNPGPEHVFVDPDTLHLNGVIDFGDAYLSHRALDLRRWAQPADRAALVDGYAAATPISTTFADNWRAISVAMLMPDYAMRPGRRTESLDGLRALLSGNQRRLQGGSLGCERRATRGRLCQGRPRAACQEGAPADARRCPMCLVATQS
jgi:hygromycin-B 7''-O-kinase